MEIESANGYHDEPTPKGMVQHLVRRAGATPVEIAAACGVSERTVYNWLATRGDNPSRNKAGIIRALYDRIERGRPAETLPRALR